MAEQYVVNNEALVASADAIRAKGGSSTGIVWDGSTGFASAIRALTATSGGTQYATGSFTVDGTSTLASSPIEVTGFDFKPTIFVVYRGANDATANFLVSTDWTNKFVALNIELVDASAGTTNTDIFLVTSDGSTALYVQSNYIGMLVNVGSVILYAQNTNLPIYLVDTYNWIAIG